MPINGDISEDWLAWMKTHMVILSERITVYTPFDLNHRGLKLYFNLTLVLLQ